MVSVSVGLMAAYVVYRLLKGWRLRDVLRDDMSYMYGAMVFWFVLVLLDGFRLESMSVWGAEVLLKVPFIVVPLYVMSLPKKQCYYQNAWLFFVSVISLVALVSGVNYLIHFDEINELLLQSKHIPIFGKIHHIYFGIYQALGIWVSLYFMRKGTHKKIWTVNAVVLLFMIHVLASRTGLVAFYASIGVFLVAFVVKSGRIKPLVIGGFLLVLVPLAGYQFSTSFRNKVLNSMEDFNAVKSGKDINYKSLAMRVEAWRTGTAIFKEHPWLGIGTHQIDDEMQRQYIRNKTILYPENRIGPHNQFLEMSMAHGIMAAGLLVLIFGLGYQNRIDSPLFLALITIFFTSFLLESYLERQQGIIAFCLFFFGFYHITSDNSKETIN